MFFLLFQVGKQYNLGVNEFLNLAILYNLIAFATQFLVGLIVDKYKIPKHTVILGIILATISLFLFFISPASAVVLVCFGNSLLHVGGGVISIKTTPNKATAPGIFVAPGALGLVLGILLGKADGFPILLFAISLLVIAVLIHKLVEVPEYQLPKKPISLTNLKIIVIAFLLFTIATRSIVGLSLNLPWRNSSFLIILTATVIMLGKAMGGIIGDRVGWVKTGIIALFVSAPLISFTTNLFFASIIGIFLFEFTMPITLAAIAKNLPGREGLAFGLTTLILVLAALMVSPFNLFTITDTFVFLLIIASAGTFFIGLDLAT